jgi:hypothetical protein
MTAEARLLFVMAFQRFCQHKRSAVRLYRALAARERNASRCTLLLSLAANKERLARQYAARLEQRGVSVSEGRDSLGDRVWRWVLVRCGVTCALAWMEWVEHTDTRLFVTLLTCFAPGPSFLRTEVRLLKEKREEVRSN